MNTTYHVHGRWPVTVSGIFPSNEYLNAEAGQTFHDALEAARVWQTMQVEDIRIEEIAREPDGAPVSIRDVTHAFHAVYPPTHAPALDDASPSRGTCPEQHAPGLYSQNGD